MKNIPITAIFCLLFSVKASAATITAIANGNWIASTTWDAGRAPLDNDVVVIPASKIVTFNGSPYPKNTPATRPTLTIKIYGTLDFSTAGNDKLYLDVGSVIDLYTNGKIQTTTSSSEIIAIYDGSIDNTVWTGTPATVNGPVYATASTSGFANLVLPVIFESFNIRKNNKGLAILSWTTSTELNTSHFEIERSSAEFNHWQYAGTVDASGNSFTNRQYTFDVPLTAGENRFRLKEIDNDGKYTYSNVASIRYNAENSIQVNYNQSTHQLSLKSELNDQLKVRIFDASGQTMYTGSASSPVIFKPAAAGVYVVHIISRDSRLTKKVMVY